MKEIEEDFISTIVKVESKMLKVILIEMKWWLLFYNSFLVDFCNVRRLAMIHSTDVKI